MSGARCPDRARTPRPARHRGESRPPPAGQLARAFDARAERFTVDEGHRVVRQAIRFPRRKQRDDVGMLQPRGERDLAAESLEDQTADEIRCENLGDDKSAER